MRTYFVKHQLVGDNTNEGEKAWPYRLMHSRDYWKNGVNVKDKIRRFIELVE